MPPAFAQFFEIGFAIVGHEHIGALLEEFAQVAAACAKLRNARPKMFANSVVHPAIEARRALASVERNFARISVIRTETVFQDKPERGETVPPRNLLSILVSAPVVVHGDLVEAELVARDLGRNFGLDAETI